MRKIDVSALLAAGLLLGATTGANAQEPKDTQKQIDELKSALPKFAIPMREVGDRSKTCTSRQRVATGRLRHTCRNR
jgi:hypothetical protein